jgi:hypothetical protein
MDIELADRITQAREAGYSDDQIAQHLGKKDPRIAEALKEGYGSKDILGYITSGPTEIETGGKKFQFSTPMNAAQFQRSATGSAVPPEQLANEYGGKPVVAEIPAARQAAPAGFFRGLGRSAAGLADTTVGSIAPGIAQQVGYPFARAFGQTPEAASATVGRLAAPFEQPFGRAFGVSQTPEYKGEASQQLVQFIGENIDKGAQWLAEKTGLPATDITNMMGSASFLAGPSIAKIPTKLGERQADKAIAASRQSFEDLPRIEAAQAAQRHGIFVNPEQSNPGKVNTIVGKLAGGQNVNDALSKQNAPRWTTLAKEDMGLPRNTVLEPAAFEQARANLAEPYNRMQAVGMMPLDDPFQAALNNINSPQVLGGIKSPVVDRMLAEASQVAQINGRDALATIQAQRKVAQDIYKRENTPNPPSVEDRAVAEAAMQIANAVEDLVVRNIPDPRYRAQLQDARARMATTYAYELATDGVTKKVDPNIIAKLVKKDPDRYTDTIKDIGQIAGNFPDIANVKGSTVSAPSRLYRSSPSVVLGTVLGGTLTGNPLLGAVTGAVAGGIGSGVLRRNIQRPGYQNFMGMPADNRLRVDMPEQAAPAITNNLPVVFDPRNAVMGPEQGRPNFTFGDDILQQRTMFNPETGETVYYGPRNQPVEDVPPSGYFRQPPQAGPVNPTFPQPPVSGGYARGTAEFSPPPPAGPQLAYDLSNLSTEQRRAYEMARGAAAEQTNALNPTWNAPPQVTKGGISIEPEAPYWFSDPAMGRSVAPSPLGDPAMARALLISDPAYRSLTPQQITDRMLDRKWVESTVDKARQKAAAFDEIARRAKDQQAVNLARRNREEMLDFAEQLEDRLNAMPTVKYGQGPKTRAAKTLPPVVITAKRLPPEE